MSRVGELRAGELRVTEPRAGGLRVGEAQVAEPQVGEAQAGELRVEGLRVAFGRRVVVADVTLAPLAPGSVTGVIGPNAAGKSTLLRAVAGLLPAAAGRVTLGGADVAAMPRPERARRIACMPQAHGCNAALSVFESVLLALKQGGGWRVGAEDLRRAAAALAALGLTPLAERGLARLSGGQGQMVALAQVMVRDPAVMLLDEPTSALDLHHQLAILAAVRRTARLRGAIVMAALHDLDLAAEFCDRLILIREGRVLAEGPPEAVLALPEVGRAYRVATALERTRRGALHVDASLEEAL